MDLGPSIEGVPTQGVILGISGSLRQNGDITISVSRVRYLKGDARGVATDDPGGNMVKDRDLALVRLDVNARILSGME